MDDRLVGKELDELRQAEPTYAEVGHTRGPLPGGYHHLRRQVTLGTGLACFTQASQTVLGWGVQRRSGLRVRPSSGSVVDGCVAVLALGPGAAALKVPVRVVYVLDEPHRKGFAYGTLPGHPETGEEAFVVELDEEGTVTFTITAFSRPSSVLARVAGPLGRAVQRWITSRYLRSLRT